MSKTVYEVIDSINEAIDYGKNKNMLHLYTEDAYFSGKEVTVAGKKLINFGSCSYLGLETDQRLKDAAIDAVNRYGTQFSSSRTFVSFTLYKELEELLEKMYGAPVMLSSSSSLGHKATIPIIIADADAIIYDHQCHISMQDEITKLQPRGVKVIINRHNRLDELEDKIKKLEGKHSKIWYFIDGIYSMYGDAAPLKELVSLQQKYNNLYLYIDDAHGMSWAGPNGTGYTLSQIPMNERMVLVTSLAKGFGSAGGVFVFGDPKLYQKVRTWGGPITYSGPQQPAVIGASVASAKLHLSNEIGVMQKDLLEKINYCNEELKKHHLPVISHTSSPIFFIGAGLNKVTFNLVKRMTNEGFFLNPAIFPAVPETCSGLRFTLTRHHSNDDFKRLAETLSYHLPLALKEEERTYNDIERAFKIKMKNSTPIESAITTVEKFTVQYETSIDQIDSSAWNRVLGNNGIFTWQNMAMLETVFKDQTKEEDRWGFHYFIVRDAEDKIVLATFFTSVLIKDDMALPDAISRKVEELRKDNPYLLSSRCFLMGTLISDGQHLYIDRSSPEWKSAFGKLIDQIWIEQEKANCPLLYMRDFADEDNELKDLFYGYGFVRMKMPSSHVFENTNMVSKEEHIKNLPHRRRFHLKKDVLAHEDLFETKIVDHLSDESVAHFYELYEAVRAKSLEINSFPLPLKLFQQMNASPEWETLVLTLKSTNEVLAYVFAYKTTENNNYYPVIIGMNYSQPVLKVYKQMLFQTIARGMDLKKAFIFLGLTATMEKRKMGATLINQVAYLQSKNNFNQYLIEKIRDL